MKRNLVLKTKKLGIKNAAKLTKTQLINEIGEKVLKLTEEKQSSFRDFAIQFTFASNADVTFGPGSFSTAVKRMALENIHSQSKVI